MKHIPDNYRDFILKLPGWLEPQALDLLSFIAYAQTAMQITGDMMEIGVYKGKSACVLGYYLTEQEQLHACDTFKGYNDVEVDFKAEFTRNFVDVAKKPPIIYHMESDKLREQEAFNNHDRNFRIWHVDGLHSAEATYQDMALGMFYLRGRGVIIADDFLNQDWLGVNQGVNEFLHDHKDYCVVAQGYNKTVITRKLDYLFYYELLAQNFKTSPYNFLPFHGVKYLSLR